jgi:hypothetical protein
MVIKNQTKMKGGKKTMEKLTLKKKIAEINSFSKKLEAWIESKKDMEVVEIPDYLQAEVRSNIEIKQKFAEMRSSFGYPTHYYYKTAIEGVAYAISTEKETLDLSDEEQFDGYTFNHRLLRGEGWLAEIDDMLDRVGGNTYCLEKISSEMPKGFDNYELECILKKERLSDAPGV